MNIICLNFQNGICLLFLSFKEMLCLFIAIENWNFYPKGNVCNFKLLSKFVICERKGGVQLTFLDLLFDSPRHLGTLNGIQNSFEMTKINSDTI